MLGAFEKGIFQFFTNFSVMKFRPFSGKVRQNIQHYLNQNLVIGRSLENGFEATFSSKNNVLYQNLNIGSFLEKDFGTTLR